MHIIVQKRWHELL